MQFYNGGKVIDALIEPLFVLSEILPVGLGKMKAMGFHGGEEEEEEEKQEGANRENPHFRVRGEEEETGTTCEKRKWF